ncbi:hypothetical protein Dda_8358 [Drechslerella dactyloides]|uniref:RTA1-domain-containing protein n=1 Tax=Drechslerella dactyloides TaxID=74499 RepID=A0AAD6NET1_DREDA|nr:hypothetical protein Dda_8358 [Drechslerella dactyloides]
MPDNSTKLYDGHDYQLYPYKPSLAAAVTFTALFAVLAVLHAYYLFKYKGWYFIPFLLGVIFEAIGYGGRLAGHYHPYSISWYVLQAIFIWIAPTMIAVCIFMTLSRIAIALESEDLLIIRPKWLTIIILCGYFISLFAQIWGARYIIRDDPTEVKAGIIVFVGGLSIQILLSSALIVVALMFHRCLRKYPAGANDLARGRKYLYVFYAASSFILVRSIFRVVLSVTPYGIPSLSTEAHLYIFDATLMALTIIVYLVVKPYGELFDEWKRRKDLGDPELSKT